MLALFHYHLLETSSSETRESGFEHLLEPPIILRWNTSRRTSGTTRAALVRVSSPSSTAGVNRPLTSPF